MGRPEHLNTPNTPEGIRRINQLQEEYDRNPSAYDEREQRIRQERMEQEEYDRREWERNQD